VVLPSNLLGLEALDGASLGQLLARPPEGLLADASGLDELRQLPGAEPRSSSAANRNLRISALALSRSDSRCPALAAVALLTTPSGL